MTARHPPIGGKITSREIAKMNGSSLRSMERAGFVHRNAIEDVVRLGLEGKLNLCQAEQIARLPRSQQPAAIQIALDAKPKKRPPWELQHDIDRISQTINHMARRWTQTDCGLMVLILHRFARQLAGIEEPEIDDAGEEWGAT